MALGATSGSIHGPLFRQGFLTVAAGLAVGLLSALALMRALRKVIAGLGSWQYRNYLHHGLPGLSYCGSSVLDPGAARDKNRSDVRVAAD